MASRSTKEGLQIHLGTLLGVVCSPLAAEDGLGRILGPSMSFFIFSRSLLGLILNSQTDPPTFKNVDFPNRMFTCSRNQLFSIQKRFCNRFGVPSGSFWVILGGLLGALSASRAPRAQMRKNTPSAARSHSPQPPHIPSGSFKLPQYPKERPLALAVIRRPLGPRRCEIRTSTFARRLQV